MNEIFECIGLTKDYGGKTALDNVSMQLQPGRIVGLLGPNGSGKTTMMKLANGLLQPTSGKILIDGHEPGVETKKITSYLPDADYLPGRMTVNKLLNFYADFFEDFDFDRAARTLERLNIPGTDRLKTLSKGNKEKVQLVAAMSRRARLYLLDEPIGGVDPAARDLILETILSNRSGNSTILISTHLIADIENILDEAVIINNGNVICHKTTAEIREESGMSLDQYFREVFRC